MPATESLRTISGGVTAAQGFRASGCCSGIKRSGKPDLALVLADELASAAGVFTLNRVKAAPVEISQRRLRRGHARGVLLNSGCANCMTGQQGKHDALRLGHAVAGALGIRDDELLLASTGLIGRRLPVDRIKRAVPRLVHGLGRATHGLAARAILTTDRKGKETAVQARVDGQRCRLGGMAKGAGMIAPNMATMLCVLTTDIAAEPILLRRLLREATERTFNRISVDGDMSTNDSVFLLASGRSGVRIAAGTRGARVFAEMLLAVCGDLAKRIVEDGEGASKLMEIQVVGARSDADALRCARQVANSPLVKTMLAGGDPNVGRIAASIGASPAFVQASRLDIHIDRRLIVSKGVAVRIGTGALRTLLSRPRVTVRVDLHAGMGRASMLTCDLTEAYVRINAGYAT